MGFFERFRKPKVEAAAAVVAGTMSAVAPAAAAEMPQQIDVQKPTEIMMQAPSSVPDLRTAAGQKIEVSVPASYAQAQAAPVPEYR